MDNLYWLNQIRPNQLALVGYKAFHLSQLLQKGHPVLPGFVVAAPVLRSFLKTIAWSDPLFADLPHSSLRLNISNPGQLRTIAQQLRLDIESAPLPDFLLEQLEAAALSLSADTLILRPSLTVDPTLELAQGHSIVSSTGLVNIQLCRGDRDSLAQCLKRLWAELYGAKSLFYWQRLNILLEQVHLAVLVQPIQSAIAAGTVHTTASQFEIQATVGLGMAIAWGEVVPDCYQVDAKTGQVQTQQLGRKMMAYQVGGSSKPAEDRATNPAIAEAEAGKVEACTLAQLTSYFVSDEQRYHPVLLSTDLARLVQRVQLIVADLGPRLDLEWVLQGEGEQDPTLFLNQVTPYFGLEPAEPPISSFSHSVSQSLSASAHPSQTQAGAPPVPELSGLPQLQKQGLELSTLPHAKLIATGLAVSGGQAIARALVLAQVEAMLPTVPPHRVLVAPIMPLDWLPLMEQAAALVSEQGSMTSHSAIIARNLAVPAVFLANATQQIQDGELLWIDGDRGNIYRVSSQDPAVQTAIAQQLNGQSLVPQDFVTAEVAAKATRDRPAVGTQLMLNLSQPNQVESAAVLPTNGVGLLRAEMLALSIFDHHHPLVWLQQSREGELVERLATHLEQFAQAFAPRPVFYRSFDFRPHEFQRLPDSDRASLKAHPMMGLRGTFSYRVDPTMFSLELAALTRVQRLGYTNLNLILPFVRTVEEFQFCARLVEQVGLNRNPHFQLWIMAEVPSVLLLLPDYVSAGVQGISIGTNDLTQLLLGVDRDQSEMAIAFEDRHPAVKRAIAQLIQQAHALGIPCSICGEAPARYPDLVQDLVNWGIDSISVAPEAVEATYWAIAQAEQNLLLKTRRQQG